MIFFSPILSAIKMAASAVNYRAAIRYLLPALIVIAPAGPAMAGKAAGR
jgi:hypothetical protein